jgi:long-subunit fatty acid transport protein
MRDNKKSPSVFSGAKAGLLPAAIVLGLAAQGAFAAGFQLRENDVAGLGRAYAGSTSAPDDAAVVVNNPAAMIDLRQPVTRPTRPASTSVRNSTAAAPTRWANRSPAATAAMRERRKPSRRFSSRCR